MAITSQIFGWWLFCFIIWYYSSYSTTNH